MEPRGKAPQQWRDASEGNPHSLLGPPDTQILDFKSPGVEERPFLWFEPSHFGVLC